MKKVLRFLPLLLGNMVIGAQAQETPPPIPQIRLIVRLRDDLEPVPARKSQPDEGLATAALFAQINHRYPAAEVQRLNPGRNAAPAPAMYLIALPAGTDARQAVRDCQQTGLFRYVELDARGQGSGVTAAGRPNDPYYGQQWYLKNNGSFGLAPARAGADTRMEGAWLISRGDSSVTVAIIDGGCKLDHPELTGRIWRNRREIANNRLDDDGNGYVDDVKGWDFAANTNSPADDFGHGTNVTGIIGATGDNGIGYAGVNWGCKLMICKGLDNQNNGYYSWWTSAIYYAVDNGARVINMSMGGITTSQAMQDAIAYANQQGVVVVASMGNNNSVVNYPAALDGVISVGATNPDDSRVSPFPWSASSGSSYGPHISVVAPGNYIFGLDYRFDTNYNTYGSGTSQAAPQVAGLASLLLTLRPQLTPAQVKTIIERTADDQVGPPTEDAVGWDPYFGHGRINAFRALTSVLPASQPGTAVAAGFQLFPNPARGQVILQLAEARLLQRQVQVYNALGQRVSQQLLTDLIQLLPVPTTPGTYWVAIAGAGGGQRLVVE